MHGSHPEARGRGVTPWGCFAGDAADDLFKIPGTLNQHDCHSILHYMTTSGHIVFEMLVYGPLSSGAH